MLNWPENFLLQVKLKLSMLGKIFSGHVLKCFSQKIGFDISCNLSPYMSQCTTKPTIRLVRPVKTQICLRINTVRLEFVQMACTFYSFQVIQRGMTKNPWNTGRCTGLVAQLDLHPTGDQEVVGLNLAGSATFFRGDLIMKYFLWSFSARQTIHMEFQDLFLLIKKIGCCLLQICLAL